MTNQEQPDTRPRCHGEPGKPQTRYFPAGGFYEKCLGCADCAPDGDTQSGGRPTAHEYAETLYVNFDRRSFMQSAFIDGVEWEKSRSSAALQEARDRLARATKYVEVLPGLREVAREHGYALAVHGSGSRDLDLIAAPWVDEVSPPEVLVEALREAVGGVILNTEEYRERGDYRERNPQPKPHGRLSWSIHLPALPGVQRVVYLDLSVMPAESTIAGLRERVAANNPIAVLDRITTLAKTVAESCVDGVPPGYLTASHNSLKALRDFFGLPPIGGR